MENSDAALCMVVLKKIVSLRMVVSIRRLTIFCFNNLQMYSDAY